MKGVSIIATGDPHVQLHSAELCVYEDAINDEYEQRDDWPVHYDKSHDLSPDILCLWVLKLANSCNSIISTRAFITSRMGLPKENGPRKMREPQKLVRPA